MEETKTNPSVNTVQGAEQKFSDAINELIDCAPEDVRDETKASILARLTEELNAFGKIAKKRKEEEFDKDVEFFAEMVNKIISNEMMVIRKNYSLAGEVLPDFYSLEFHGYRTSIIGHINSTVLRGTRFLLVVKRTQIEYSAIEGLEGTGYKPKNEEPIVRYSLALVDKVKDLDEIKPNISVDGPTTTKKPGKKVAKKK